VTLPATIREVLTALGERAPWATAGGFDPVGLQLGDPAGAVGSVALCHEVTPAVVAAVEAQPVELLVAYHPLLFRPTARLVAGPGAAGRAHRLIRAGVALAVVHTNFDVARGGAADALAEALGLEDARGFAPLHGPDSVKVATFLPADAADRVLAAVAQAGAATIGNYTHCAFRVDGVGTFFAGEATSPAVGARGALNREPEVRIEFVAPRAREDAVLAALVAAHPYEEPAYDVFDRRGEARMLGRVGRFGGSLGDLVDRVRSALRVAHPRVAGDPGRTLERVAVLPGAGKDWIGAAAQAGAAAFVTGDIPHHPAREAIEAGLALVDPGHAASERPGLARLLEWIRALGLRTRNLLELDPDPWSGAG
jgi:dinuclear metal center YbgI/SA1388 family protein